MTDCPGGYVRKDAILPLKVPGETDCHWCRGAGYRSSYPADWYDDKPGYVTTCFPCDECDAYERKEGERDD